MTDEAQVESMKHELRYMVPQGSGAIVNIRINAVAPGLVETPMIAGQDPSEEPFKSIIAVHPLRRIARADEIAEAVVWLSSDKASFVTGVVLPVDGGYTVP